MKARAARGTSLSPPGATPSSEEIRSHLAKVTSSKTFIDSARLTRLLGYLVDETLAGRGPLLKEYKVGLEVFDRPESFDPLYPMWVEKNGTIKFADVAATESPELRGPCDPRPIVGQSLPT